MSALAAIQIKRRQIGLDDDDWRDIVERVTGQRSTRGLTLTQTRALLGELDRLTGGSAPQGRRMLQGAFVPKIQALWISAWNLGLVTSREDRQLIAFVRRQTGIDHANWLLDNADALKVIEALKAMLARRGVRWTFARNEPAYVRLPGYQIARARYALIHSATVGFEAWIHGQYGQLPGYMSYEDWIPVMNRLGRQVRQKLGPVGDQA